MAINFPNSPSNGTQHTASGITWTYDGTTWKSDGVTSSYVLPTASATTLGGIKVGNNLTINAGTGVLDASAGSSYANSDVDAHLNTSTASSGEVLSWNGSDYDWVADQTGGGISGITIQDQGVNSNQDATTLNFTGSGVSVTGDGTSTKTITIPGATGSSPTITWTLTANGSSDYVFSGDGFPTSQNDPTLYLIRGQTYRFTNNTGGHPFRIQSTTATSGGGTAYNSGVTNQDATGASNQTLTFVVPMDAPDTLYYQCTAHPAMFGTINILTQGSGGGSGLQARTTGQATASSLANNASANLTITAAKTYALHAIQTSHAAWVTLYTDSTARTQDAGRSEATDPVAGSGVIAEVITSDGAKQIISPGAIGWNNDGTPSTNAYVKVVNKSGSTQNVVVTLHFVSLEA